MKEQEFKQTIDYFNFIKKLNLKTVKRYLSQNSHNSSNNKPNIILPLV